MIAVIAVTARVTLICNFQDGASAHPREYSIRYTDHNLHTSSSVRYLSTTQGMSLINIEYFVCLRTYYDKTCQALELATRKRIVWVAALHRVCLDNTVFLPSFPIHDMTDLELERAALAPRKWIELCHGDALHSSDSSVLVLHPRTTRIIINNKYPHISEFFMVPGGRYLVTAGRFLLVWDLGYVSTVDCKLVASVGPVNLQFRLLTVQATSDGKGLIILAQ